MLAGGSGLRKSSSGGSLGLGTSASSEDGPEASRGLRRMMTVTTVKRASTSSALRRAASITAGVSSAGGSGSGSGSRKGSKAGGLGAVAGGDDARSLARAAAARRSTALAGASSLHGRAERKLAAEVTMTTFDVVDVLLEDAAGSEARRRTEMAPILVEFLVEQLCRRQAVHCYQMIYPMLRRVVADHTDVVFGDDGDVFSKVWWLGVLRRCLTLVDVLIDAKDTPIGYPSPFPPPFFGEIVPFPTCLPSFK